MDRVLDADISWIRENAGPAGTLAYAIPQHFDVYGVINLLEGLANENALLDAVAPEPESELIAGWIDRGPWAPPAGDEHFLYWDWRYKFRRVRAAELRGLPPEGEGSFPDLLFPPGRTWLLSLLWDDGWRSVGASEFVARRIEERIPEFERLEQGIPLHEVGRVQN